MSNGNEIKSPIKTVLDAIADFMNLDQEHCYLFNQNWIIPKDKGLCVVGQIVNDVILDNNLIYIYDIEEQTIRKRQTIAINIFSYDLSALNRKDEIVFALQEPKFIGRYNDFGIQTIDKTNIRFNAVNEVDGIKTLYRFVCQFDIYYQVKYSRNKDYTNKGNVIIKQKEN
jgi:hypothetical protein